MYIMLPFPLKLMLSLKSKLTGRSEIFQAFAIDHDELWRKIGQYNWETGIVTLYPGIGMSKDDIRRLYLYLEKWVSDY